jgi:hypothetical protein
MARHLLSGPSVVFGNTCAIMTVNPDVIFLSVIAVRRSKENSNRPGSNAEAMALKRDKNENESKGGCAGFSEAGRPASVGTEIASSQSVKTRYARDVMLEVPITPPPPA